MFRRTAAPMPQSTNALGQLQDRYLQTPYIQHNANGSFYNERGYSPPNMQQMVSQGLGEYYGNQMQLPQVQAQPPNAGPGGSYQWKPNLNIWQDQSKTGGWRPGAGGNYWGQKYGQATPNFDAREIMNLLKYLRNRNR